MKTIQTIFVCGLALALGGLTTLVADTAKRETKATVRAVHGDVNYSLPGGQEMKLHVNEELPQGATVTTGADSYTDLQVNGRTSTIRIAAGSKLTLQTMDAFGSRSAQDSDTMLNLHGGTVLGNIKKISGDSHYEVETPRGVAGVRGTDIQVLVVNNPDGSSTVTFTSVTGTLICSAVVLNNTIVKILHDGESWTPGEGDVVKLTLAELDTLHNFFANFVFVLTPPGGPGPGPINPFPTGGTPTGGSTNPSSGSGTTASNPPPGGGGED